MAEFRFKDLDGTGLISIRGRFTLMDKDDFQGVLADNVDLDSQDVALDLRELDYVDSSGIGDFIKLKMEATKRNNSVFVFGLKDAVEKAFKSARLDSVFTILSDDESNQKFNLG